jgi:hypothetical protein
LFVEHSISRKSHALSSSCNIDHFVVQLILRLRQWQNWDRFRVRAKFGSVWGGCVFISAGQNLDRFGVRANLDRFGVRAIFSWPLPTVLLLLRHSPFCEVSSAVHQYSSCLHKGAGIKRIIIIPPYVRYDIPFPPRSGGM